MIRITTINNLKRDSNTTCYAIVRSIKSCPTWVTQLPTLAPSNQLLHEYLNLRDNGLWNTETFHKDYVPKFLKEMKLNATTTLNMLYKLDKLGHNISLGCFCKDESLCHRSIVAGLLSGVGCNVVTDTGMLYNEYYKLFKEVT